MQQVETFKDHILFKFTDDILSGRFINATESGRIVVSSQDTNQSSTSRWAQVTHVGPEVEEVKVGDFILIEPGMWTSGFWIGTTRLWKTDESKVMVISDQAYTTY